MLCFNRSDYLALLHKKLGIQIIADYYSQWKYILPGGKQELQVKALIDAITHNYEKQKDAYAGWDGTFLYMRTVEPYKMDVLETPNRVLRPWQSIFAKRRYLGLEEQSEIALLDNRRAFALQENSWYCKVTDNTHTLSLEEYNITLFRLFGLLSHEQRKKASSGGIKISELTVEQRAVLVYGMDFSWRHSITEPVVGIYKDGMRVDKPGTTLPTVLASIEYQPKTHESNEKTLRMNEVQRIPYQVIMKHVDGTIETYTIYINGIAQSYGVTK